MSNPPKLIELIERFENNLDSYKRGNYNETQVRREFIDPLFKLLGWDIDNEQGYAEAYKDVIHEDAIKVGGISKAPDYCFRIGGARKFFVEAKKPSTNIKEDIHPSFQLRRYAWSAKLPLSILTDFEEFAVYDCRIKPVNIDKPFSARTIYLTYKEYAQRWDEIADIFSRDAILKGSFDKYVDSHKAKKGTTEVDKAFLEEIERWRELLARNIALRNPTLSQRELNYSVQMTIDRIIFLRICEDRNIEPYGRLMALQNGTQTYKRLLFLFQQADNRYNSGLFHFNPEKGRPEDSLDTLTPELAIDDNVMKEIFKNLYYPNSPYEFSVLPANILGQTYEQFLGKVIRLTSGHRAVVEDKPEVKKAGGVYYTPTYIVDYIVKQTVGKLLEGRKPGPQGSAAKLRILDPACGSGSFLLGAYQFLLDWHRDQYISDNPDKWAKGRIPRLYKAQGDEWRLTTDERKRILLNNIYGVDIDSQAAEVTKLSLLLKVLEGETEQSITSQFSFLQERVLPDLGNNIKCGNSLIGPDFYTNQTDSTLPIFDEEERFRINVFDWDKEFPEIMEERGFDAVIGNPPYVRQETLGDFKNYFSRSYKVYHGVADLYTYFIERGISLIKTGGIFSYIVANKWMRANYGEPLRRWLRHQNITEIIDFGDLPVFKKATTYPCILVVRKNPPSVSFSVTQVSTLEFKDLEKYAEEKRQSIKLSTLDDKGWSLAGEIIHSLLNKIKDKGIPLKDYVDGKIYRGILTGLNEAFVINKVTKDKLISEDPRSAELIKPFLAGREIKRYETPISKQYLILIPKGWTREQTTGISDKLNWLRKNHPAIAKYLSQFADSAEKRYDKGEYWWELRTCDYYAEFEKPKIIVPTIVQKASYAFDDSGFYSNDKTSIIVSDDLYLLGILNSKVADFIMHSISSTKQGGYFEYKPMYVSQIPVRAINVNNSTDKSRHENTVKLIKEMLALHNQLNTAKTSHEKTAIQRQIDTTDSQIDSLVYELYDLTEEEIKLVEKK